MGRCCVELEMEVVDCGYQRRLMADGARSEKILARTLFLVFGGKTIGRSPLIMTRAGWKIGASLYLSRNL